jgi:hypothetical protein
MVHCEATTTSPSGGDISGSSIRAKNESPLFFGCCVFTGSRKPSNIKT